MLVRGLLVCRGVKRAAVYVPTWAVQFLVGVLVLVLGVAAIVAVAGTLVRGPTAFFEDLGKTFARVAPQPQADIRSDDQLKVLIRAMPEGELRVGSVVQEQDRVVFTVTAERNAVHAAVAAGDELRIGRGGEVEIVPTGVPGALDRLQRAIEELRQRYFGR